MILTKTVKIKISSRNFKHYTKLGHKNLKVGKKIIVPVKHLPKGSRIYIKVKCDICGKEKEMRYCDYLKNIKNYNIYTCSQKCAHKAGKNKKTCLKLYGNENYTGKEKCKETWNNKSKKEIQKIVNKRIKTCLNKYEVENPMQNKKIQEKGMKTKEDKYDDPYYNNPEKYKQTMLQNHGIEHNWTNKEGEERDCDKTIKKIFGVDNVMKNKEVQEKGKNTKLKNYGDPYFTNPKQIKETWNNKTSKEKQKITKKVMKTKKEKYEDENYNNIEQIIQTNLERYNTKWTFQTENNKFKSKQTCLINFGFENPMQNKKIQEKAFKTKYKISYDEYLKQLPDFIRYRNEVLKITRKQPLYLLKNIKKRSPEYHLDHKYSIKEGFKNNILPYIVGNIVNLEMLPYKNNTSKHVKCSISKKELFNLYNKNIKKSLNS